MTSFQTKIDWKWMRNRENKNSNKIAKKLRKLKNMVMASFQAKIGCKRLKKIEN